MRWSQYLLAGSAIFGVVCAQVIAETSDESQTDELNEANVVSVQSGVISSDVQMVGTAVINGAVFVDGEKLPNNTTSYTSKIAGKTYLVKRGKNGNVSVIEK